MNGGGKIPPTKPPSGLPPDGLGSRWYRQVRPPSRDTQNAGRPPAHDPPTQPVGGVGTPATLLSHPNGIAPGVGRAWPPPVVSSATRPRPPRSTARQIPTPRF